MIASSGWLWELDGWIVAAGVLCAVAASLPGNFLVLRGNSLIGDAISHAVLPGLAAAFLISGSRQSVTMFIGAALVGVFTAALTHWLRSTGRVDEGVSMGVAFTTLFALGLIMITRAADVVDLDPECVLYGAIELTPLDTLSLGHVSVPRVVVMLAAVLVINLLFVLLFFKELQLTSFDPSLADALGIGHQGLHYLLMTLVAVTAVASFESVGNILVVAMFVVPPATARLLTDSLARMIALAALLAAAAGVLGHVAAITVPRWFGYASTTTAGMMTVVAGVMFALAMVAAPKHGLLVRWVRSARLARSIGRDDLLALLFRHHEREPGQAVPVETIGHQLAIPRRRLRRILAQQRRAGQLVLDRNGVTLTPAGRRAAQPLVRAHRLWEQYLVERAGMATDQIHSHAEVFEHVADRSMRDELERQTDFPSSDPHGSPIPGETPPGQSPAAD